MPKYRVKIVKPVTDEVGIIQDAKEASVKYEENITKCATPDPPIVPPVPAKIIIFGPEANKLTLAFPARHKSIIYNPKTVTKIRGLYKTVNPSGHKDPSKPKK